MSDAFFDIETEDWQHFVVGGMVTSDGTYRSTWDELELYEWIIEHDGDCWTWNGGKYDIIWVADTARAVGHRVTFSLAGPRITRAKIKGFPVTLRDAMALWPVSLAKALRGLPPATLREIYQGRDPKDTGLQCDCGEPGCKGYCRILRAGMSADERDAVELYLRGDCLGGLAIVEAMRGEADRCDYKLGGTIGGSAWRTAREWFDLPKANWEPSDYLDVRTGYYGGRSQVFHPAAPVGHRYDIHSAYPAALSRVALPVGEIDRLAEDDAQGAFEDGVEGIYRAIAHVPTSMHVPPLPWRMDSGRVCYPVGQVIGNWSGIELRYAASLGVDLEVVAGIVWDESRPILADACERIWQNRDRYPDGDPWRDWHKWFANSLTGKLAENPEKRRVILNPDPAEIRGCPADHDCGADEFQDCGGGRGCCIHRCTGHCQRWEPVGAWSGLWSAPFFRISDCGHVHWAAYLTAATRIELHRQLTDDGCGGLTALYCDTDSCYAAVERTRNLGPDLGQWGYEGRLTDWLAVAPKAYRYRDPDHEHGPKCAGRDCDIVQRCKGLEGISTDEWLQWFNGATISRTRGVSGLRSAARSKVERLFQRKLIKRSRHDHGLWYGDRVLGEDGITHPQISREAHP